jgi:uncharacterized membrane protein YhaH (DUF805 family)
VAAIAEGLLDDNNSLMNPRCFWSSFIALSIYESFFIILPRFRDIGMSGWWLLLYIIPVANIPLAIILMFRAPNFQSGAYVEELKNLQTSN